MCNGRKVEISHTDNFAIIKLQIHNKVCQRVNWPESTLHGNKPTTSIEQQRQIKREICSLTAKLVFFKRSRGEGRRQTET